MKIMLFWMGIGILVGFFWGRHTTVKAFTIIFKQFQDEVHSQYLQLLDRQKVKIKPEARRKYLKVSGDHF